MLNLHPKNGTKKRDKTFCAFCGRYFYLLILWLGFVISLPVIAQTQPLTVIQDSGQTTDVTNLVGQPVTSVGVQQALFNAFKKNEDTIKDQPILTSKVLFPAISHFSYGEVTKHQLSDSHFQEAAASYAFYVIGDDDQSIAWANKNAAYLKQIHALGIVTNIRSEERLEVIKDETGLWLTTANLDGLTQTVQTTHYPFLVYKGWVLQ